MKLFLLEELELRVILFIIFLLSQLYIVIHKTIMKDTKRRK